MGKGTKMRTVLITTLIFLIASTAPSYAELFTDVKPEPYSSYEMNSSTNYPSEISYSDKETLIEDSGSGLFKSPSDNNPLIDRPGSGGGIGQGNENAPIGKGLHTLLVCCLIYGIVKISAKKRGRFNW